jgi:ribosomal protein S18 acetylase RimI-like enzyme
MLDPNDRQLAQSRAVSHVAFGPMIRATAGVFERDLRLLRLDHSELNYALQRARSGRTVTGVASVTGVGIVATGSYNPIGEVAEIVGVGTLPIYRRQGFGSDVVHLLCEDAFSSGIKLVALVAEDEAVVRIYQRLGFRRIGTCMSAQDSPA